MTKILDYLIGKLVASEGRNERLLGGERKMDTYGY
jgi:hypothetical protein